MTRKFITIAGLFVIGIATQCSNPAQETTKVDSLSETPISADTLTNVEAEKKEPEIPRKEVEWKGSTAALSATEKQYVGSWVASVTELSLKTGGVMISFGDEGKKINDMGELVESIVKNIDNKKREDCIWLELYNDRTGFWCGCMKVNGEPSVFESTDIMSGKKLPYGLKFDWYADKKGIKIKFEDDLRVPYSKDSVSGEVKVKYWNLNISKPRAKDGSIFYSTSDYFPEYDLGYPIKNDYEYLQNYMYGEIGEYKKAIQ